MMRGKKQNNTTVEIYASSFKKGKKLVAVFIAVMMAFYSVPSSLAATFGTEEDQNVFGDVRGGSNLTLGGGGSIAVGDASQKQTTTLSVQGEAMSSFLGQTVIQDGLQGDRRPGGDLFDQAADDDATVGIPDELRGEIGQIETKISDTESTWTLYGLDTNNVTEFHHQFKPGHIFSSSNGSGTVQKTDNFYQIDDDYNEPLNEFQTGRRQKAIPDWDYVKFIYQSDPNDSQTWTSYIFDVSGGELDMGTKVKDIHEIMGEVQTMRQGELNAAIEAEEAKLGHPLTDAELDDLKTKVYAQIDYVNGFGQDFHLTSVASLYKDPANNNAIDGSTLTKRDYNNDRLFDTAERFLSNPNQLEGLLENENVSLVDNLYDDAIGFNPTDLSWGHQEAGTNQRITEVFSMDTNEELNALIYRPEANATKLSLNPFLTEIGKGVDRTLFAGQIIRPGTNDLGEEDGTTVYENDYADATGRPDGQIDSRSKAFNPVSMDGLYDAESYNWLDNDADGTWDETSWGYEGFDAETLKITETYKGQYTLTDLRSKMYFEIFASRVSYGRADGNSFTEYDNGMEGPDGTFTGDADGLMDSASLEMDSKKLAPGERFVQSDYKYAGFFGDLTLFNPTESEWTHKDSTDKTISEAYLVDLDKGEIARTYAEITAQAQLDPALRSLFADRISWKLDSLSSLTVYDNGTRQEDGDYEGAPDGTLDSAVRSWNRNLLDETKKEQFSQADYDYWKHNGVFTAGQVNYSYLDPNKGIMMNETYKQADRVNQNVILDYAEFTAERGITIHPDDINFYYDSLSQMTLYDNGIRAEDGTYSGNPDGLLDSAIRGWNRDLMDEAKKEAFSQADNDYWKHGGVFTAGQVSYSYLDATLNKVVTEVFRQEGRVNQNVILGFNDLKAERGVTINPDEKYWKFDAVSQMTLYDNGTRGLDETYSGDPDGAFDSAIRGWNADLMDKSIAEQFSQADYDFWNHAGVFTPGQVSYSYLDPTLNKVVTEVFRQKDRVNQNVILDFNDFIAERGITINPDEKYWKFDAISQMTLYDNGIRAADGTYSGNADGAFDTATRGWNEDVINPGGAAYQEQQNSAGVVLSKLQFAQTDNDFWNHAGVFTPGQVTFSYMDPNKGIRMTEVYRQADRVNQNVILGYTEFAAGRGITINPDELYWKYDSLSQMTLYDNGIRAADGTYSGNADGAFDSAILGWNAELLDQSIEEQFSQADYDYWQHNNVFTPGQVSYSYLDPTLNKVVTEVFRQEGRVDNQNVILGFNDFIAERGITINPDEKYWKFDTVSQMTLYDNGIRAEDGSYSGNADGAFDSAIRGRNADSLDESVKEQFSQADYDYWQHNNVFTPGLVSWSYLDATKGFVVTENYDQRIDQTGAAIPIWSYDELMTAVAAQDRTLYPDRISNLDPAGSFTIYDNGIRGIDSIGNTIYDGDPDGIVDEARLLVDLIKINPTIDQRTEFSQTDFNYNGVIFNPSSVAYSHYDGGLDIVMTEYYNKRTNVVLWDYNQLIDAITVDSTIRTLFPNGISRPYLVNGKPDGSNLYLADYGVMQGGTGVGDPDGIMDTAKRTFLHTMIDGVESSQEYYWMDWQNDGIFDNVIWNNRIEGTNIISQTFAIPVAFQGRNEGEYAGGCDFGELRTASNPNGACIATSTSIKPISGVGGAIDSWIDQLGILNTTYTDLEAGYPNIGFTETYQGPSAENYGDIKSYQDIQLWVSGGALHLYNKVWDIKRADGTTDMKITSYYASPYSYAETTVDQYKEDGTLEWKKLFKSSFNSFNEYSRGDWSTFTVPQSTSTATETRDIEIDKDNQLTSLIVTDLTTGTVYQEYHDGTPKIPPAMWPRVSETHLRPLAVVKESHKLGAGEAAAQFSDMMNNNAGQYNQTEIVKYHDLQLFKDETGWTQWDSAKTTVVYFTSNKTDLVRKDYYRGASAVSESTLTGATLDLEYVTWANGAQYLYRNANGEIWKPDTAGTGWTDLTSDYNQFLGSTFVIQNPTFANLDGYVLERQI